MSNFLYILLLIVLSYFPFDGILLLEKRGARGNFYNSF